MRDVSCSELFLRVIFGTVGSGMTKAHGHSMDKAILYVIQNESHSNLIVGRWKTAVF